MYRLHAINETKLEKNVGNRARVMLFCPFTIEIRKQVLVSTLERL